MKLKRGANRGKQALKLHKSLPVFKVNEGSELEPINLQDHIRNVKQLPIHFSASLEGDEPLPKDITCMPDGVFGGRVAVGTARPAPYHLVFKAEVPGYDPLVFRAQLIIYARTKDTDIAEYNDEKVRKFKVQEIMRESFMHIGPTVYPMEPVLSENMAAGMEAGIGHGYGHGGNMPVHPILGSAAQFSGDFKEENAIPAENNRPEIQNKLELINSPTYQPGFNPTPTATKPA